MRAIRKQLIKRTLDMISDIANRENKEEYNTFWENFGRNLKLGVIEDAANKDALAKLLRYVLYILLDLFALVNSSSGNMFVPANLQQTK